VRLIYPIGGLVIGLWLYHRGPGGYLEFAWWLWHVSPGIRRIVDYQQGGWDPENPMSLTPFLVSGIAILGITRRLPELRRKQFLPWAVAGLMILYGYLVGILRNGPMPATHSLITWITPLAFGLYAAVSWRRYPEVQSSLRRVFLWGSLVLAGYGVYQYAVLPWWDRDWMTSSGIYSVGQALPYEVRVFSLVNAPLPFAILLVAGLFLSLAGKGIWRVLSLALGGVALMLSLVRSVWLAAMVGLILYLLALPRRAARHMLVASLFAIGAIVLVPLLVSTDISGPTVDVIKRRALTLTDITHDVSYKDRASFLDNIARAVVDEPLGHGLGSTGVSTALGESNATIKDFDNGIFAVFYTLGWVGGALFLAATLGVIALTLARRENIDDWTVKAARAVAVICLILALAANVFEGVSAAVLWGFAGLAMAGQRWDRWERGRSLEILE
jgi:hypothetical protein